MGQISTETFLFFTAAFLPSIVSLLALSFSAALVSALIVAVSFFVYMQHQLGGLLLWGAAWIVAWIIIGTQRHSRLSAIRHRELIRTLQRAQKAGINPDPAFAQAKKKWWQRA